MSCYSATALNWQGRHRLAVVYSMVCREIGIICLVAHNGFSPTSDRQAARKEKRGILVGPPMLTTTNGFGKGASSSCQFVAAMRSAAESAW